MEQACSCKRAAERCCDASSCKATERRAPTRADAKEHGLHAMLAARAEREALCSRLQEPPRRRLRTHSAAPPLLCSGALFLHRTACNWYENRV